MVVGGIKLNPASTLACREREAFQRVQRPRGVASGSRNPDRGPQCTGCQADFCHCVVSPTVSCLVTCLDLNKAFHTMRHSMYASWSC